MDGVSSVAQVLGLAPDSNSAAAGRRLGARSFWSQAGHRGEPGALWGLCQGSGQHPYQTVVDLTGPAYKCSCPSRKFPCKHALGLMLCWVAGDVPDAAEPPGFAATWLQGRMASAAARESAGAGGSDGAPAVGVKAPADPKAAAKRVADRAARVSAGLDELDQWLCDQIRAGLAESATPPGSGGSAYVDAEYAAYRQFEAIGARMIDAQAPGVAAKLRQLPRVRGSGDGWHARLLERYAQLRLLIRAHRRLAELPPELAAAVRAQVGYPMAGADVLAGPAVRDTWSVLGRRDTQEDRLISRRIWLQGERSGRTALVLSYLPNGQSFDVTLVLGTSIEADVHFYPGGLRALVGTRHAEPGPLAKPATVGVAAALARYAAALAADPWAVSWPFVLGDVAPVRDGDRWLVRDENGDALPIAAWVGAPWVLVAVSGGEPVTVLGEWTADGLAPLSVIKRNRLVRL